jgi:iron complex outermembrane receptor protein
MKKSAKRVGQNSARHQATLTLRPIAAAVSALLLPVGAYAQEVPVEPAVLESVVVTGIRHSIESSVAIKRGSDSIVEAVSAEDLGKLPDVSIADSLARLPGLTAQRVDGRAEVISIRGLAPKYAVTLLNGRELVSTGDNRSVEYDQFPAELINSATVYKTPDAALGAQGLSGTINLDTVKPLAFHARQMNFNARAEENSNGPLVPGSSARGARISASYIDQFADGTVGLAFGFAHLDSPGQEKYSKSWWWGNSAVWGGPFLGLDNTDPNKAPGTLQGFELGVTSTSHVRDGAMAVLEFKPNQGYHSELDLYYSKFAQKAEGREFQANLPPAPWCGIPNCTTYSNVGLTQSGNAQYVTSGSIANDDPYIVSRYDKRDDKIMAVGWNNEFHAGAWTTVADLSYSKATRDEVVAEMYASSPTPVNFSSFSVPLGDGFVSYTPSINIADPANVQLRGISGWGNLNGAPQAGSLSPISVDDAMKAVRLSAKRDLSWGIFSTFEGGANVTHRSKDYTLTQDIFALRNSSPCLTANVWGADACAPIPAGLLQSPVNLGFAGIPQMISFDVMDAINSGAYISGPTNQSSAPGRIWGVSETVSTFFGKLGLRFGSAVPFHGNVGVQVVHANQRSTGIAWDNGPVPMSMGASYTNVLPSLNLVGDLTRTTYLHFGLARVLARPNLDDLRAGFVASVSPPTAVPPAVPGKWSGNGGNPFLRPWLADEVDLSLEQYFGKRSYVSAAWFNKKLKNSIYVADTNFDFTGFPNSSGVPVNPAFNNIGVLTAPVNGQGGYVRGLELAASMEFGLWVKPLDGFGVQTSFSHTGSNVPGPALDGTGKPDLSRPLEGMSGRIWSFVGYYEKNGFEARFAQRYRSDFVAGVRGVWITNSVAAINAERITDLQFGYNFETGRFKGLSFLFQINNLTDTPYRTSTNDDAYTTVYGVHHMMPERYQQYGRQYLLGANYKL